MNDILQKAHNTLNTINQISTMGENTIIMAQAMLQLRELIRDLEQEVMKGIQ